MSYGDNRTPVVSFTIPKHLLAKMDKKRGDISRSRFVVRALEAYLKHD